MQSTESFFRAGPAGIPTQTAFSQETRWPTLDRDREQGCIRAVAHAYSREGGLAVLRGNIAENGCVVKTAGVDESIWVIEGEADVTESQEEAVELIIVVSEMGEQWSPKIAPSRMAATVTTVICPYMAPSNWNATGIAVGIKIAMVPKLVPVAKEVSPATTNTKAGNTSGGRESPSVLARKAPVCK